VAERDRGVPPHGLRRSEAFRKRLLHEAGIAVLADIHFGRRVPGDGQHIRFSYAASNEAIEQGIGASPTSCARATR
jgi:aspartate/methionine/tyrosine aminotransferase